MSQCSTGHSFEIFNWLQFWELAEACTSPLISPGHVVETNAPEGALGINSSKDAFAGQTDLGMDGHGVEDLGSQEQQTGNESVPISSNAGQKRQFDEISEAISVERGADEWSSSEEVLSDMTDDEAGIYIRTPAEAQEKEIWWNEMFTWVYSISSDLCFGTSQSGMIVQ